MLRCLEPANRAGHRPHRAIVLTAGLAVLLVILLYATELPIPDAPAWLDNVNAMFAPFRMPMLLFLSGVLLDLWLAMGGLQLHRLLGCAHAHALCDARSAEGGWHDRPCTCHADCHGGCAAVVHGTVGWGGRGRA